VPRSVPTNTEVITLGVDTHKDIHVALALDGLGRRLGARAIDAAILIPVLVAGQLLVVLSENLVVVLLGVLVFTEPMPPARLAGFALVWLALMICEPDVITFAPNRAESAFTVRPPLLTVMF
jgi:hypothetical protein